MLFSKQLIITNSAVFLGGDKVVWSETPLFGKVSCQSNSRLDPGLHLSPILHKSNKIDRTLVFGALPIQTAPYR
jgi:hypothetical protein